MITPLKTNSSNINVKCNCDMYNIPNLNVTKHLEIILDNKLNFKQHIEVLEHKVSQAVGVTCKFKYLPAYVLKLLYFSFISDSYMT